MPQPERKPLASLQSKEVWSIRFAACEREAITAAAQQRGLDPSTFAHDLSLMGLNLLSSPVLMESYIRETAVLRASHEGAKA